MTFESENNSGRRARINSDGRNSSVGDELAVASLLLLLFGGTPVMPCRPVFDVLHRALHRWVILAKGRAERWLPSNGMPLSNPWLFLLMRVWDH